MTCGKFLQVQYSFVEPYPRVMSFGSLRMCCNPRFFHHGRLLKVQKLMLQQYLQESHMNRWFQLWCYVWGLNQWQLAWYLGERDWYTYPTLALELELHLHCLSLVHQIFFSSFISWSWFRGEWCFICSLLPGEMGQLFNVLMTVDRDIELAPSPAAAAAACHCESKLACSLLRPFWAKHFSPRPCGTQEQAFWNVAEFRMYIGPLGWALKGPSPLEALAWVGLGLVGSGLEAQPSTSLVWISWHKCF